MSDARRAFSANPLAAFVATGFGSGLSPIAPGTAGSVVGLVIAWLLRAHGGILGSPVGLLMSGLLIGLIGVFVSNPVARALGSEDPGCIVIDEVAGQIVACAAIPLAGAAGGPGESRLWAWIAAFVLFRLFDVWKPLGIRRIQSLPGGWGIVVDDILAGVYAFAVLVVLGRLGVFGA
ncbi:MAG TPA: phosphatidylglycerophosphatase A [Thermoanaerobaculia bacterium]|jgi:phosphatidylglycerophosphatase A|nr:phosphatidylglycerophosphatase A [Thermoanaerobaculia bacterium]